MLKLCLQVECMRIRQTEAGLYLLVKKRGRPQSNGSPSSRRVVKTLGVPSVPAKRSPDTENPKKVAQLGKRKVCLYKFINKLLLVTMKLKIDSVLFGDEVMFISF